jgi:hypothetical protein
MKGMPGSAHVPARVLPAVVRMNAGSGGKRNVSLVPLAPSGSVDAGAGSGAGHLAEGAAAAGGQLPAGGQMVWRPGRGGGFSWSWRRLLAGRW